MTQRYLDALKESIRNAVPVKKEANLRAKKWTKGCFELLSDLVSDGLEAKLTEPQKRLMGISISSKTLSNLFSGDYKVSYPIDPRSMATLNKLSIFAGYRDWNHLVEKTDLAETEMKKSAQPEDLVPLILREAIDLEFRAYASLPVFPDENLYSHFSPNSSAFKKVAAALNENRSKDWVICNPYNPSAYEILDFKVLKIEVNRAEIETEEYWLLCWWSQSAERYVSRYKDVSFHRYLLDLTEEGWRVRANISIEPNERTDIQEAVPIGSADSDSVPTKVPIPKSSKKKLSATAA